MALWCNQFTPSQEFYPSLDLVDFPQIQNHPISFPHACVIWSMVVSLIFLYIRITVELTLNKRKRTVILLYILDLRNHYGPTRNCLGLLCNRLENPAWESVLKQPFFNYFRIFFLKKSNQKNLLYGDFEEILVYLKK